MELKELLTIIQRWAWLLTLGLLVGLLVGYLFSYFMDPVYEASTQLMISRQIQEENPEFNGLNSQQLVQTHIQLLKTQSLLDATIKKAGVGIEFEQVSIQQIPDTQIIEIKIKDHNPDNSVIIANTMVQVLIERNEKIQSGQYIILESRLTKQVEQVQDQIADLQDEYDQAYQMDYQDQLKKINEQIIEIQTELSTLRVEINALNPVYSQADRLLLAEKEIRVEQLQSMFVTYEGIRANLLVLGRPYQSSNIVVAPVLSRLQPTLDLYQKLYLTLIEDLEKVRLARLQQTTTVVQIEAATFAEEPVSPIPVLYSILSGIVGVMLAIGLIFIIENRRSDHIISEGGGQPVEVGQEEPEKKINRKVKQASLWIRRLVGR